MTLEDIEDAARRELVERDIQLAQLARATNQARDGAGTVVSVHGAAGTGRSRLLTEAAELARDAGLQVLSATGRELERDFPFGVAFQLLEPASRARAVERAAERQERAPDLMALLGSTQPFGDDGIDRFAAVHRLFALIRELALGGAANGRAGLAIVVDDADRADRPSLELLAYLAARISDLPIALIAAARDGAPEHETRELRALQHAPPGVLVRTADLSLAGVATLVRRQLPGAARALCEACAVATGGNPFLLVELLGEARRLGVDVREGSERISQLCPQAVVRWVRARLSELPAAATRLVYALVAIGGPAPVQRTAAVAQLDAAVAARAADTLAAAGLLSTGVPLVPASPLVATAIRASIPAAEWEQLARRASERHRPLWTIDDHGTLWPAHGSASPIPPAPAQQPSPTAAQRLAVAQMMVQGSITGQDRAQIRHLARLAWGDGSLLDGPNPDAALATQLADALLLTDDLELCLEIVGHPWFSTAERDAPGLRARAGSCRAWSLYHQGRVPTALAEAQAISAILPLDRPSTAHGIEGALAACRLQRGELQEAAAALAMLDRPEELTDLSLGVLLDVRAQLRLAEGRPHDALRDALEAGIRLRSAAGSAEPGIVAWRSTAALAKLTLSERDDARRLAGEALEVARSIDAPRLLIRALRVGGLALGGVRGLQWLSEAVEVGGQNPPRLEHVLALVDLGAATRRANRRAEARRLLAQAMDASSRFGLTVAAARARKELAALGRRRRGPEKEGIEALTASERRVADLAAAGRTTRQMAAELFVTPKTVEFHLRNIYLKLNVRSSRRDLVRTLRSAQRDAAEP